MTQADKQATLPPTPENLQLAQYYLQQFLKKVSIKVKGNVVMQTMYFELPDHELAVAFAKNLKETFQKGQ
jgi:hypothetical protein